MTRAIAFAVVLISTTTALADDQKTANELFARGQTRYEAGDYREAIKLFDEAYQLVRDPVYLFNIAQAYRKVFDCVPAAKHLERYLAEATDVDRATKTKINQQLRELRPCVEERTKATAPIETKPQPVPVPVQPVKPQPTVVDHGRGLRIGGIALAGVGVAGLVVGALYSSKGAGHESDLAACDAGCSWTPEREAIDQAGRRANTIAAVSWIAGGVALAGGATLYLLGRSKVERLTVVPTAGGAAVSARFSF